VSVAPAGDAALPLLRGATGVFLAGGDQVRLMRALRGTPLLAELRRRHADGVVVGGTSAGAAVMGALMITGDDAGASGAPWSTIRAGRVVVVDGLSLLAGAVVDQHFTARRRHNRLLSVVLEHPTLVGVGIDEETAVVVGADGRLGVVGDGVVSIYDARRARDVAPDSDGDLAGYGVRLHLLTAGRWFDPATPD